MTPANNEVIGIALFGSRAREDHAENSDVDLLLWTKSGHPEAFRSGIFSMSLYPRAYLIDKAAQGDLFTSHLIHEGRPLWDPLGLLDELKAAFRPRSSYEDIIACAEDLGAFLIHKSGTIDAGLLNRRMAWVVRTILIARATERKITAFAPTILAKALGARETLPLIAAKDRTTFDIGRVNVLAAFLQTWGCGRFAKVSGEDFEALFRRTGNSFGLKTLTAIEPHEEPDYA